MGGIEFVFNVTLQISPNTQVALDFHDFGCNIFLFQNVFSGEN